MVGGGGGPPIIREDVAMVWKLVPNPILPSQVGIKEGGRTGLVAVTVGLCFLGSLFISPLIQVCISFTAHGTEIPVPTSRNHMR